MSDQLKRFSSEFLAQRTRLIAYCFGLLQDRAAADDLFQEVYVKMAEAVARGEDMLDLERWCRGVARNLALHHWREKRTSKLVLGESVAQLLDQGFEEQRQSLDAWEGRKSALENCLRKLPEESRRMMVQKYVEGVSIKNLASVLRRTPEATMQALFRVRRSLMECIELRLRAGGAQ